MNAREVIEMLSKVEPDTQVFVSSDEEGNSYRLASVSLNEIMCDQGEWVSVDKQDLADGEYEGWEESMVPAVVLW